MTDSSSWLKRGLIGVGFIALFGFLAIIYTSFFPK
jgi:hypothetical protein